MIRASMWAAVLGISLGSGSAVAAPQNAQATSKPAEIDDTRQFDFIAKNTGESYRIQVYVPHGPPPPAGYPVLYLLDGNVLFGSFADAISYRSRARELEPAVVVGIEGGPGPRSAERDLDFTAGPTTPYEKTLTADSSPDDPFGGAESFRSVIQDEIKPRVRAMVRTDSKREMLFGWSLGGLFTLHIALTHTSDFSAYAALSPSLWYGGRAEFTRLPAFSRALESGGDKPRIYIGVGSREEDASEFGDDNASRKKWGEELTYSRMVQNAVDMGERLKPIYRADAQDLTTRVFPGETHHSVPWTALNPVLNFLLGRPVVNLK